MANLIADIGNCHFGNFTKAKQMIYEAKQNGVDLVKGQAFTCAKDVRGSMPDHFYEMCKFSQIQYLELIEYAESIDIPMFFSIFSSGLDLVFLKQKYCKLAACQTDKMLSSRIELCDEHHYFISMRKNRMIYPVLNKATVLYVSDYLSCRPKLFELRLVKMMYENFGYSDHTLGIDNCEKAVKVYGAQVIEKHMTLEKHQKYNGVVFRDTIHGATPKEFYELAKRIK